MSRTGFSLCVAPLFAAAALAAPARTGGEAGADRQTGLDTVVGLPAGTTAVGKVMSALSQQTGLTIEAADYLRERRVVVDVGGLSARQVLDALAELHGWSWREDEPGRYLLARPKRLAPRGASQVAAAVFYALPSDVRRFLGVEGPTGEATRRNPASGLPAWLRLGLAPKAGPAFRKDTRRLFESLMAAGGAGETAAGDLKPDQERWLVLALFVLTIAHGQEALLYGRLFPYEADLANAQIELSGGQLSIGAAPPTGGPLTSAFGTPVAPGAGTRGRGGRPGAAP